MTPGGYATVRGFATHFAVTRNHENPESEQVIEENARFSVVETVTGAATKLARRGDPRQRRREARWAEPAARQAPRDGPDRARDHRARGPDRGADPSPGGSGRRGWLAWGGALRWHDLVVLAITYTVTGLGITVGYHRLFTHRSFKTTRVVRAALAVLSSMAVEGPVTEWVATHRKHHQFSDQEGDPHSPHTDHAPGLRGTMRGLGARPRRMDVPRPRHGHPGRYAKDLLADRDLRCISRTFPLWVALGMALPFGLGVALTGSVVGGLTGLLWGGAVRVFLLHHTTFSINSLCHTFERSRSRPGTSRATWHGLAPLAFGEAWHNNHHAFPTSARHGLGRWQMDPGGWFIRALERSHLAWDVIRISPARQVAKRGAGPGQ